MVVLLEIEHDKAHRTKTNDGTMMDGGEMAQIQASTVHQKRETVYAALQYAVFTRDCEELKPKHFKQVFFLNKNVDAKKRCAEWSVTTGRH